MKLDQSEILNTFSGKKILAAIFLGVAVTCWLFYNQLKGQSVSDLFTVFKEADWTWLLLAVGFLSVRDLGYVYRIKNLTQNELTWKGSGYTIMLWEFASAVTPSVVGGTAVAVFILNKEGIKFGKSLAYVMLTAILDNSFFLVGAPIVLLLHIGDVFPVLNIDWLFGLHLSLEYIFYISYSLIAVYTVFMSFSVLFFPKAFRSFFVWFVGLFYKIFRLRILIKLRSVVKDYYDDIITASFELKGKNISYWLKAILSTLFVWCSRYFILNAVMAIFKPGITLTGHLEIFAKQLILWITQLISPTPGGSGFAEYFLGEIFGGGIIIIATALLWRLLTYYTYLFIGSVVLPKWLKRVFIKG